MGYINYYLIVFDFINYAKQQGIPVGPGRGSGAGSLAAYCVGITNIDPIRYNLLFERFLNPERVSMPDFDVDFCYERRQEVIDYVMRKIRRTTMWLRSSPSGPWLPAPPSVTWAGCSACPMPRWTPVAKLVPSELKMTLDRALEVSPELKAHVRG